MPSESQQWSVKMESDHLKCSLNEVLLIDAKLFRYYRSKRQFLCDYER